MFTGCIVLLLRWVRVVLGAGGVAAGPAEAELPDYTYPEVRTGSRATEWRRKAVE